MNRELFFSRDKPVDICWVGRSDSECLSGGRVVAGSNPVTPTDEKSLIFNRISRIFLLWYIVRKMAVVHKWYINGRYSKNFNLSR